MKKVIEKHPRELSFTVFETIVAIGLLMTFMLEMAGGQGTVVNKVEYSRRSTDAIWLAKRIMAQVEYNYQNFDLKELDTSTSVKDQKFQAVDVNGTPEFEYTYSVEVKEWKFPLLNFLLNGGAAGENGEEGGEAGGKKAGANIPGLDAILDQIFKGHILKIARVEVSWPDGARRDSVGLTYLMANTKALDEFLNIKKPIYDQIVKKMTGAPQGGGVPFPPPGSVPVGDGSFRGTDGIIYFPDGSKVLTDGSRVPPPAGAPNAGAPPPMPLPPGGNQLLDSGVRGEVDRGTSY